MKCAGKRPYRQAARAEAAEQTRRDVMAAAVALWRRRDLERITLADIAREAGVTVQTVVRRFGSKDGVIAACIEEGASGIEARRDEAPVDDPPTAVAVLLAHYEADGADVLRTLALEDRLPVAQRIATHGRTAHRTWCARVFAPYLPRPGTKAHEQRLDAYVAATDLYLWKLLRRDLGRSAKQVETTMMTLVEGLISTGPQRGRR